MANPQREHGHVRIATTLYEAIIKMRIPGEARQVMDAIIRQTYGWNTKAAPITLAEFSSMTGLAKPEISRAIRKLNEMNLISRDQEGRYKLQKDFDEWRPLAKTPKANHWQKRQRIIGENANKSLAETPTPTLTINKVKTYINSHALPAEGQNSEKEPGTAPVQPDTQEQGQKPATGQRSAKKQRCSDPRAPEILNYLNQQAGTRFQPNETNLGFISARLQEPGITPQICNAVIDIKVADWQENKEMRQYLRPETLFNKTKFAQYSGIAIAKLDPPPKPPKPKEQSPYALHVKRMKEIEAEPDIQKGA